MAAALVTGLFASIPVASAADQCGGASWYGPGFHGKKTASGQKFNDLDGDGVKEAGETGIGGVTINLDKDANGSVDATTSTDGSGNYSFPNLGPGTYRVREVAPAGSTQTTLDPADISALSGSNVSGIDFGNQVIPSLPPPPGPAGGG